MTRSTVARERFVWRLRRSSRRRCSRFGVGAIRRPPGTASSRTGTPDRMRDLLILGFVFAMLPFCFFRPYIGALMWVWISLMNPHRLTWGPAYGFPFAMLVAVTTMAG